MASADQDLCYISATGAFDAFRARKLSPVELMQAVIARCEEVNPKVNALTYRIYDKALEQARAAEASYAKTDGRIRPLERLPASIKDFHSVKGEITTYRSRVFKDFRP